MQRKKISGIAWKFVSGYSQAQGLLRILCYANDSSPACDSNGVQAPLEESQTADDRLQS